MAARGSASRLADAARQNDHITLDGGRRLRVLRGGEGPPLALFDAGAFGIYVDGANVVRALAELGIPAVTYTRAGLTGSDPMNGPPTPDAHGNDMLSLLQAMGQYGPVVLIGHSMAGLRLHLVAERRTDRVRGLVLVDAMVPGAISPAGVRGFAASLRPFGRVLPAFGQLAEHYPNAMRLSGQERADKLASVFSADHIRATRFEVEEVARTTFTADHGAPMIFMPAGRIAMGSRQLAHRTGSRLVDMSRWGHASVLSPEPARLIAQAARTLL